MPNATATAFANVVTGEITVLVPDAEDGDFAVIDGKQVFTQADVEPWAEDEMDMGRADEALAGLGWATIGDWTGIGERLTAPVRLV